MAAILPSIGFDSSQTYLIVSMKGVQPDDMPKYNSRIAHLPISDRLRSLGVIDSPLQRKYATLRCRQLGLPIMTISFAEYVNSGDELTVLHTIAGISPVTALEEFREIAIHRLAGLS